MTTEERLLITGVIRAEIAKHQTAFERAQQSFAYGSRSAEKTMERHTILETALESYMNSLDGKSELLRQSVAISEAIARYEAHIEKFGERSLQVRQVIGEIKSILRGGD